MDAEQHGDVGAALVWATGASDDLPAKLELSERDEERLLWLVDAHGLVARFGARLDRDGTAFDLRLRAAARDLRADLERRVKEHAAAVCELAAAAGDERGLIVLKGMAAYFATGRREMMRCGDVDLLARPGLPVEATLLELGYRRTREAFMHELGEFTRESTEIDVHEHFPVYRYSDGLRAADLRPRTHPGTWRQSGDLEKLPVTHARALDAARLSRQPGVASVQVPCPELQAVVLCAHGFMNYTNLWSISHREKPYIRLAELADVRDLASHPAFDFARFSMLVDHLGASDAVAWAQAAGRAVLGSSPLPAAVAPVPSLDSARFPRCLWWRFWADLPVDVDTLVNPSWLRMDRVVDSLGGAELQWRGGRTDRFSTFDTPGATRLTRLLTLPNADVVPFSVELTRSSRGLAVHACVAALPGAGAQRLRVDLGHSAVEWIHAASGAAEPHIVGNTEASTRLTGAGYEVTLEFPLSDVSDVALLVGVTRIAPDGTIAASTLVPAHVGDDGPCA